MCRLKSRQWLCLSKHTRLTISWLNDNVRLQPIWFPYLSLRVWYMLVYICFCLDDEWYICFSLQLICFVLFCIFFSRWICIEYMCELVVCWARLWSTAKIQDANNIIGIRFIFSGFADKFQGFLLIMCVCG